MTPEVEARLNEEAQRLGVTFPPMGRTPRRWWRMWKVPTGPVLDLPSDSGKAVRQRIVAAARSAIIFSLPFHILGTVCSALVPWAMGRALDTVIATGLSRAFAVDAGLFVLIVVLMAVGDATGHIGQSAVYNAAALTPRRALGHRTASRARALSRSHSTGDIVAVVSTDTRATGQYGELIAEGLSAIASVSLIAYLMLSQSVTMGLLVLFGVPLSLMILAAVSRPLEKRQEKARDEEASLTTVCADAVQGLRILRGIGGEKSYAAAYHRQSEAVRAASVHVAGPIALLTTIRVAVPLILSVLIVGVGATLVYRGQLSSGQLLSYYGYAIYLRYPMWIAKQFFEGWARVRVATRRIAQLCAVPPDIANTARPHSDEGEASTTDIAWEDAQLRIDHNDLNLKPRLITGLVTPKPALGQAIARAYGYVDETADFHIDSVAASDLSYDTVRSHIVLSEASPQVFSGTLRDDLLAAQATIPTAQGVTENIRRLILDSASNTEDTVIIPAPHPRDGELLRALSWAHADDVLSSLPGGLDGYLNEKGRNLSGGQRQRVVLARAYATNAPILILVDPTSALDSHTEARIGADLQSARGGRTTLVVTQSPHLLRHCDEIVVLDTHGVEIARGTYDDIADSIERIAGKKEGGTQ
ncbi:MAG: hypothetical protein CSA82_01060 [Actinobacteria bacterium]|nr:MAG: hypothetical protein CSA82_01060 [Actinomycetota bacterium]